MKKLSPTQVKVLRALAEPRAHLFPMAACTDWILTNHPNRVQLPTTTKLLKLKLIFWTYVDYDGCYKITPAGRDYLAALDKEASDG